MKRIHDGDFRGHGRPGSAMVRTKQSSGNAERKADQGLLETKRPRWTGLPDRDEYIGAGPSRSGASAPVAPRAKAKSFEERWGFSLEMLEPGLLDPSAFPHIADIVLELEKEIMDVKLYGLLSQEASLTLTDRQIKAVLSNRYLARALPPGTQILLARHALAINVAYKLETDCQGQRLRLPAHYQLSKKDYRQEILISKWPPRSFLVYSAENLDAFGVVKAASRLELGSDGSRYLVFKRPVAAKQTDYRTLFNRERRHAQRMGDLGSNFLTAFLGSHCSETDTTECTTMFMERAHGDLSAVVKRINDVGGFSYEERSRILRTFVDHIVKGIRAVHRQNKAHLDLKEENVLAVQRESEGEESGCDSLFAQLTDFAFSRPQEPGENIKLRYYCGTVGYSAPEVQSRSIFDGKKADMYSFGVTVCRMIDSLFNQGEDPAGLAALAGRLGVDGDLLLKTLASDPAERPSADQLLGEQFVRGSTYRPDELFELLEARDVIREHPASPPHEIATTVVSPAKLLARQKKSRSGAAPEGFESPEVPRTLANTSGAAPELAAAMDLPKNPPGMGAFLARPGVEKNHAALHAGSEVKFQEAANE